MPEQGDREARRGKPFFKKVVESQMAWAKRTLSYERANTPDRTMASKHFLSI